MRRFLSFLLILSIGFSLCGCNALHSWRGTNSNVPDLQLHYELDITASEKSVTRILPWQEGFICFVGDNEFALFSKEGFKKDSRDYPNRIVDIYVCSTPSMTPQSEYQIIVALDNGKIDVYTFDSRELEWRKTYTVEDSIKTVSGFQWYTQDKCHYSYFALTEEGKLYGWGFNSLHVIDAGADESEYFLEPTLCYENIHLINSTLVATETNEIFNLTDPGKKATFLGDIQGLFYAADGAYLYTEDALYSIDLNQTLACELAMQGEEGVWISSTGRMAKRGGEFYYTGLLSAEPVGKEYPMADNQKIDIPEYFSYCLIYNAVICYNGHQILYYAV